MLTIAFGCLFVVVFVLFATHRSDYEGPPL